MEHLLDLYAQSFEKDHPLVCFDEKSVELHGEVRRSLPTGPRHPKRQDYEYRRNGTRNVFLFLEPHAGQRHTLVTQHRTKEDFAKAMRYLVDELYPKASVIELVMDNLNTHTTDVLIEIFGKAEADRILSRLRFHFTPVHGSWLNMAEIELSVMQRQCLNRRMGHEFTLGTELVAWEEPRNAANVTIHWKFTQDDARRVFAKYYPAISSC